MKDLTELQRQGFNKSQISAYVDAAKGQGLNIGERESSGFSGHDE